MTKAAYNRLSDEDKAKHDEYMAKYYAGAYYKKLLEKFAPNVAKMDKSHLAYACCNGGYLFGLDHFAWKKLKELGPDKYQLEYIVKFGEPYNPDIYEEACDMFRELGGTFTT